MTDQQNFEAWRDESPNQRYGYVVWEAWQAACASKQEEIDRLQALLSDAADAIEEWGAYASPYFQEKWDLVGDIARIRAAVGKITIEEKPPVNPEEVYSPHTEVLK